MQQNPFKIPIVQEVIVEKQYWINLKGWGGVWPSAIPELQPPFISRNYPVNKLLLRYYYYTQLFSQHQRNYSLLLGYIYPLLLVFLKSTITIAYPLPPYDVHDHWE
jgi:hypothetical protein